MAVPGSFGGLLRHHRLAAGLTQEELAERADLSARGLAYLEVGRRRSPHRSTVRRLAAALQLDTAREAALHAAARGPAAEPDTEASYVLTAPLTPVVGREREEAAAADLLRRPGVRLLTLTGAGGVGKTRLALRVADTLGPELADEVAAVALESVREPDFVVPAIARALGVREEPGRPLRQLLAEYLRGRELLLLLDNFEQVLEAAPLVPELLAASPQLKVLVTSRAPLRVPGEQELIVPSLEVPDADRSTDPELVGRSGAVELFLQRARAIRPDLPFSEENAATLADICRRLDGLPLAIELAAARVRVMPLREIASRLEDGLHLLRGGAGAPTRQQTLRATLDWSYDLLPGRAQALFRRLGAFVGGWTLDAVEAVCSSGEALDLLSSLVEQSLVVAEPHATAMRYRFLAPVLRYAQDRLAESGEGDEAARAHADHYLTLAEQASANLVGPEQGAWLDWLELENANLRAALRWLRERGDTDWQGLRLASALWRFWWLSSSLSEGRAELRALLDLAGTRPPPLVRAQGLQALGELAFRQDDRVEAREVLQSALELVRTAGDRVGVARAMRSLGLLEIEERRYAEARALFDQCLAIERADDDRQGLPWTLTGLGWLAIFEGDHAGAEALLREALGYSQQIEDRDGIARQLNSLAQLNLDRGDPATAALRFADTLQIYEDLGFRYGMRYSLEGLADVAAIRGEFERALRLAGSAAAVDETIAMSSPTEFTARHQRRLARAWEGLGEEAGAAFEAGRALALDDAIAEALG